VTRKQLFHMAYKAARDVPLDTDTADAVAHKVVERVVDLRLNVIDHILHEPSPTRLTMVGRIIREEIQKHAAP
jgi:hypothetical protein